MSMWLLNMCGQSHSHQQNSRSFIIRNCLPKCSTKLAFQIWKTTLQFFPVGFLKGSPSNSVWTSHHSTKIELKAHHLTVFQLLSTISDSRAMPWTHWSSGSIINIQPKLESRVKKTRCYGGTANQGCPEA